MKKFLISLIISLVSISSNAADLSIDMLNKREDGKQMVYSQDVVKISVGDTVTWLPTAKGHNVHFIAGPDGFEIPKPSKLSKEYSFTFDTPGIYLYQCTPHKAMGMIALVVVGEDISNKEAIASVKTIGKSKKRLALFLSEIN